MSSAVTVDFATADGTANTGGSAGSGGADYAATARADVRGGRDLEDGSSAAAAPTVTTIGADYTATTGTLTFAAGESSKNIPVEGKGAGGETSSRTPSRDDRIASATRPTHLENHVKSRTLRGVFSASRLRRRCDMASSVMTTIHDFVTFTDSTLDREWSGKKIPISDVYEAYIESKLDIPAEKWDAFWDARGETMSFRLTDSHVKWAFTNFFPEVLIHSKKQDKRVVGDNYNRGNDFYNWFLGESMVYTSAWFPTPETPLEQAQYAKIDHCCDKLLLKKDETLLDIGCGWGTFVARSAKERGAKSHGVCLAEEQVAFGLDRIKAYGVQDRASVEVRDYRNVTGQYDKIVSLEMVEHVGIKNLDTYFEKVHSLLKDDGLFNLQWTGIRNLYSPQNPITALKLQPEDLIWGLFMNRYIFPGADASLPLSGMLRSAEKAGFEIADVENMSPHYVRTLRAWRDIWVSNRQEVVKKYGERMYRLWYFFLHWSAIIGDQGSAFTYNVTMHKNDNKLKRSALKTPRS